MVRNYRYHTIFINFHHSTGDAKSDYVRVGACHLRTFLTAHGTCEASCQEGGACVILCRDAVGLGHGIVVAPGYWQEIGREVHSFWGMKAGGA